MINFKLQFRYSLLTKSNSLELVDVLRSISNATLNKSLTVHLIVGGLCVWRLLLRALNGLLSGKRRIKFTAENIRFIRNEQWSSEAQVTECVSALYILNFLARGISYRCAHHLTTYVIAQNCTRHIGRSEALALCDSRWALAYSALRVHNTELLCRVQASTLQISLIIPSFITSTRHWRFYIACRPNNQNGSLALATKKILPRCQLRDYLEMVPTPSRSQWPVRRPHYAASMVYHGQPLSCCGSAEYSEDGVMCRLAMRIHRAVSRDSIQRPLWIFQERTSNFVQPVW